MRYLINGANGFIGRSLIAQLCEDPKNEIFAVDLSLDKLGNQSNIVKIPQDLGLSDGKHLPGVDCIVHAAALLGVDFVEKNPLRTVLDNISMFKPLVRYSDNDSLRFVFFSTSEVYGDGRRENDLGDVKNVLNDPSSHLQVPNLIDPRSSYPISKIVGEFITNQFPNSICLRPHNIYGPQMGDRHVIPQLISKISKAPNGNSVSIYNPSHIRSFCFINDAVEQIIHWIGSESTGPVNIGNPSEPVTIEKLFEMLAKKMDKNLIIKQENRHLTSPHFRRPKIQLGDLSYTPLSEGLDTMIGYYS